MIKTINIHRETEDNWDIIDSAEELRYENTDNLKYLGYELKIKIKINKDSSVEVLKIEDVNVEGMGIKI